MSYHAEREYAQRWDSEFGEGFRSQACDCGAVKEPNKEACDTCTFLDGLDKRGEVISFMRTVGGYVTIADVARELGRDPTAVHRSMKALVRMGRAVERHEDTGTTYTNLYALTYRRRRRCRSV